jgi:hypothetical protein
MLKEYQKKHQDSGPFAHGSHAREGDKQGVGYAACCGPTA